MPPLRSTLWAGWGWALLALLLLLPTPSHALRVMTYNLLNFSTSTGSSRQAYFRTVLSQAKPDLLLTQEVVGLNAANQYLNNVLNVVNPGEWALAPFTTSPDTERACFYRTAVLDVIGSVVLPTTLRDINGWFFRPDGTDSDSDFRVYAVHLKASTGTTNENRRLAEATVLRNHLNALPSDTAFMVMGDFNMYSSSEPAWAKLTGSEADNDGRLFDPVNRVGAWNNNAAFADVHTQSTRTTNLGDGGALGGMDDRFDMILINDDMQNAIGIDYVLDSYTVYGQDGNHFNQAINAGTNNAVPDSVADALHAAADHLPVFVNIDGNGTNPAIMVVSGDVQFGAAIIDGSIQRPVVVANQAMAPAVTLIYTTSAGNGFTIPAAPGPVAPGAADSLWVTMDTNNIGARAADIIIMGNDLSNPADTLQATGVVVAHAQPSLESVQLNTSGAIFLGSKPQGTFADSTFEAHNFMFGPLQAAMDLYDFAVSGPDAALFSLVGFAPINIAATPGTVTLHFDDSNATAFTVYTATLTLMSRDDNTLPGATNLVDLTLALTAVVTDVSTDAQRVVRRTQLHRNIPNPFNPNTMIAFDLQRAERVQLMVFDSRGRRVRTLLESPMDSGTHRVVWDGRDEAGRSMASGVYFYRLRTAGFEQTHRMTLVR